MDTWINELTNYSSNQAPFIQQKLLTFYLKAFKENSIHFLCKMLKKYFLSFNRAGRKKHG